MKNDQQEANSPAHVAGTPHDAREQTEVPTADADSLAPVAHRHRDAREHHLRHASDTHRITQEELLREVAAGPHRHHRKRPPDLRHHAQARDRTLLVEEHPIVAVVHDAAAAIISRVQ
ncbi:MAG: hypothetical protein A2675_01990 [Candidatus Yonathbacteria bacterium RIFCSPHIGHO2_01_FULL_51_10]|uniref:Uncharacterized protein n=1 Tax=Candidatus Yonathbacteria bacterium RIFCSPHIGHO2_01_FULL_51_10 TaxID=1802723 RepID=A0A1G2SB17_9BACT|nr:MAG: hypothetical protein A2675_01990 [Candidatus Yonathbacteria bacterium RIFCSPHIGHO2_01_FULL_51_10]